MQTYQENIQQTQIDHRPSNAGPMLQAMPPVAPLVPVVATMAMPVQRVDAPAAAQVQQVAVASNDPKAEPLIFGPMTQLLPGQTSYTAVSGGYTAGATTASNYASSVPAYGSYVTPNYSPSPALQANYVSGSQVS